MEKGNKEHKSYEVSTENKTTSKQKEDTPKLQEGKQPVGKLVMKRIKRPTKAPPPPPTASKKVHFKPEIENVSPQDSGYESSLSEDSGHEEISNYQEKKSKASTKDSRPSKLPKEEPIYATIRKEHIEAKRESRKKQAPVPKPKNLGSADQQVSTKTRIVGVTSQNQLKVNQS